MSMLVLVGGAPGSGKTTIAHALRDAAPQLVLMERDDIKEVLVDADPALATPLLGLAAFRLAIHQGIELLRSGCSVVIVSNFRRGLSEAELAPLLALPARCLYIHCHAPADIALARVAQRTGRHWVHQDLARLGQVRDDIASGQYEALALDVDPVVIDTTQPHSAELAVRALHAATAPV